MWPWDRRKRASNDWLDADRRERVRMVLATLAFVAAIGGGIALAAYALIHH